MDAVRDVRVDFLNITVNGTEDAVLGGAIRTIQANRKIKISFPFANVSLSGLDRLQAMGFIMAIADAPHRPWEAEQFLYACAVREDPGYLLARGFREVRATPATRLSDDAVGRFIVEDA
jgi:hypothetical protein